MHVDQVVGRLVRAARQERGLSLQQLAERLRELGLGYDKAKLSRIENGQAVTVTEWLELSAALAYPPLLLVLPVGLAEPVEVLPGQPLHADRVSQWIEGAASLATPDGFALDRVAWFEAAERLHAWQELREHQADNTRAYARLVAAQQDDADDVVKGRALDAFEASGQRLYKALREVWRRGDTPPRYPAERLEALRRVGIDLGEVGVEVMDEGGQP
jgi:transcriptional regulator with XRE-family HTH domain